MKALACLAAGLLAPLTLPGPPPRGCALLLASIAMLLALTGGTRRYRLPLLALVGCAWSLLAFEQQLGHRVTEEFSAVASGPRAGLERVLEGRIVGLPERREERLSFRLHVTSRAQGKPSPLAGRTLLVRWHLPAGPDPITGERWRLSLRIQPPRGRVNFQGPDLEAWYFASGIDGVATVTSTGGVRLAAAEGWSLHGTRGQLAARLRETLAGHPGLGLVLALAIADRSAMDPDLQGALRATGTGHLLAISGLHVGMVGLLGWWFGYFLSSWQGRALRRSAAGWPPLHGAWLTAMLAATAYAALAGFGVSTRRALIMLAVAALCVLGRRRVESLRGLALAAVAVLFMDPRSPAQAGFWLSFTAVGVLLATFAPRTARGGPVRTLLQAQLAVSLVTWPLALLWFQHGAGLGGLPANLLAIPWVSLITLPLVLLSLLLLPLGGAPFEIAAWMSADSARWLVMFLERSQQAAELLALHGGRPRAWSVALAMAGAFALTLPRGLRWRWLGVLACLPLLLPTAPPAREGDLRLELLDVGQGLAVMVETRRHALLYDTGPGAPGRWDLFGAVLRPAFSNRGRPPDWVLVSHADLDHAGGLQTLRLRLPARHWLASGPADRLFSPGAPWAGVATCDNRRRWDWDRVRFRVLHPSAYLPYRGNDSSCVLSIRGAGGSVLLPGDIGRVVERRLVAQGLAGHDVLLAAHHGSRSSSDPSLLHALEPKWVLIAAGAGNRFGFPHADVLDRLERSADRVLSTADCGALRLELPGDGPVEAHSARRTRTAPWRWPAAPACP